MTTLYLLLGAVIVLFALGVVILTRRADRSGRRDMMRRARGRRAR